MKIAIHKHIGSFSDRWIQYCNENQINYKLVNCYDSNIIEQLDDCSGLMWHWNQNDYKAGLFARQLTFSLELKGIVVFPNVKTAWHFDDKVGQKYLFESIDAPLVKSYVFYNKQEALSWLDKATFPKVFKLRSGAGSINVSLIKKKRKAKKLIRKAFGKGFSHINRIARLKDRFWVLRRDKNILALRGVISGFARMIFPTEVEQFSHNQKGYIYFQDFIPNNDFDSRLIVIGDQCFGIRRYCRNGDFRASGSGILCYDHNLFDKNSIQIAFDTAKKLDVQSVAFDFVMDHNEPKIIEISYCFPMGPFSDNCPGFWDRNLNWHEDVINLQYLMIKNFLKDIKYNISFHVNSKSSFNY